MLTFTVYRTAIDRGSERFPEHAYNQPDAPQYEGVVFHDGSCAIRWMTDHRSTSVWANLDDLMAIHGHPEYGTVIVWHDGDPDGWSAGTRWVGAEGGWQISDPLPIEEDD